MVFKYYLFIYSMIIRWCAAISGCFWYSQSTVKAGLVVLAQLRQSYNFYNSTVTAGQGRAPPVLSNQSKLLRKSPLLLARNSEEL